MIKTAINRILELSTPNKIEHDKRVFVDKDMTALPELQDCTARALSVNTLTSILDYIHQNVDKQGDDGKKFVIHIADFNSVVLYKELNRKKERESLLHASINNNKFDFGRFLDTENFIINLQANFVQTDNLAKLIKLCGNIIDGTTLTQKDDGITQTVTAKTGLALVKQAEVPNPIKLAPFRTFTEIEQPESSFIFRLKKYGDGEINAALFEADGEAWKRETIQMIKTFFESNLGDEVKAKTVILA